MFACRKSHSLLCCFQRAGTGFCGVGFYTLKALTRENIATMPLVWWYCYANVKGRLYCSKVLGLFNVFESPFCSPRRHLIDQKYSKNCTNVKYYCKLKNCFIFEYIVNVLLWSKQNFQHHYSSMSHDPSEIILIYWFSVQAIFLLKTVVQLLFFMLFD